MKKMLLTSFFAVLVFGLFAQVTPKKEHLDTANVNSKILGKNEISANVLMLGYISVAELSYERLFENSGIGVSSSFDIGRIGFNYSFLSYYRLYFGKKKAAGFFIEGNAVFYNAEKSSWGRYLEDGTYIELGKLIENQYGFGVALGGKFLNKNGFIGEAFGGVAKVFGGNDRYFPRVGITLGKRF